MEHLAALLVTLLIVSWVVMLRQVYQTQIVPLREEVSAWYAARVALTKFDQETSATVQVGQRLWRVTVTNNEIEVKATNGQKYFTLKRDDLD